jgi:cellulose binding protein with CBM2 domain
MRKRIPVAWPITAVAFCLAMFAVVTTRPAVAAGNPYQRGPAPTSASVAASRGTFATAHVSVPAGNGFKGGMIYYPTDASQTYGGIAIVPGYTAKFADEEAWMGPWLASFGFVVIGVETNSADDYDTARGTQLLAALDYLTQKSPVRNKVDASRLAVAGHSDAYGKPFMQTEFGGDVSKVSTTKAALVAYIKALKSAGGQGIFYWEPEGYSPFTGYNMVAWDSSTRKPTAIMDGFLEAGGPTPPTTAPTTVPPTTGPTSGPTTSAPGGAVSATYRTTNTWSGGYQGEVTVTAGSAAITGWTVKWTLASGQGITQLWNGTLSTSGSAVTVRNTSYNGALAAGASTTFGFVGSGTASTPSLTVTTP